MRTGLFAAAFALTFCVGCGGSPLAELPDDPDELTLFSIHGVGEKGEHPQAGETLYGYPVLGKVEVDDPA